MGQGVRSVFSGNAAGPDVDVGFRLAKHVGKGELVLDLILVEIMLSGEADAGTGFYLKGYEILTGCFDDRSYPVMGLATRRSVRGRNDEEGESASVMNFLDNCQCLEICQNFKAAQR